MKKTIIIAAIFVVSIFSVSSAVAFDADFEILAPITVTESSGTGMNYGKIESGSVSSTVSVSGTTLTVVTGDATILSAVGASSGSVDIVATAGNTVNIGSSAGACNAAGASHTVSTVASIVGSGTIAVDGVLTVPAGSEGTGSCIYNVTASY